MAEIGTTLGGRYRLLDLLGQGGMATIFRATDTQLGRDVAVKLLRPEYLRDPDFSSRFRYEARSAASLSHPNIVATHDYGEDPSGPFIVMELVDGQDLATILRASGALPPHQAARIAAAVGRALAAAHGKGIIHRDVKPGNVLIGRDGQVKVVDFGIARAVAEAQMTLPGTALGSVHYFSPEQARGEPTTAASDIYSLGIVLYEALTGQRPWEGDSAASVALARLSGPIPDPAAVRPSIPAALAAIVRRALTLEPDARFGSAAAMADALDGWLADAAGTTAVAGAGAAAGIIPPGPAPTAATRVSGVARPNPAPVRYAPEAYDDDEPPHRTSRHVEPDDDEDGGTSPLVWLAGLVAVALLAVVGFLVFQLLSGPPGPTEPETVVVPGFIGMSVEEATAEADRLGLRLVQSTVDSDEEVGTVVAQDPPVGQTVDVGSDVRIDVAGGPGQVATPNLRGMTEAEAIEEILRNELTRGERREEFDPVVPLGEVAAQSPSPGVIVARGAPVDYTISLGPEPSPTPEPTPEPTPTPTPDPTPTPTPEPTPTPTPTPVPTPTPTPDPSPTPEETVAP